MYFLANTAFGGQIHVSDPLLRGGGVPIITYNRPPRPQIDGGPHISGEAGELIPILGPRDLFGEGRPIIGDPWSWRARLCVDETDFGIDFFESRGRFMRCHYRVPRCVCRLAPVVAEGVIFDVYVVLVCCTGHICGI